MAFNKVVTNPGSGGSNLLVSKFTDTDSVVTTLPGSALFFGAIDTSPTIVSASSGLPVAQQGTWTVSVTGVSTAALQTTGNTSLNSIDTKIVACDTGSVTISSALPAGSNVIGHVITDTGSTTAITGNVTVVNSGTFATQAAQSGAWNLTNISGTISLPTGAATAANQSTEIASLASIDGKITAVNTGAVVVSSSALPTGAATAAKQPALGTAGTPSVDVISVQGHSGMTAILVDGSAITQPVSDGGGSITIDGTVAISGLVPGTSATSLGKSEDAIAGDGDTGIMALAVRKDTAATTVSADGDYSPLIVDANGRLHVISTIAAAQTIAATQSGTWNIGSVTSLTEITNVVHIDDNSGSLTVDDGGLSLSIDDNGGSITIDGTVSINGTVPVSGTFWQANQPVSVASGATTIGKAEDTASANADVGVPAMAVQKATPANTSDTDGDYEFLQMSAGRLWTSSKIDTALPAGTNAIGKLAANTGVTIGAVEIAAAQTLATVTAVTTLGTITNVVHVDDNAGSITVDAPVATPVFVRLSDGAAAITTLPVQAACAGDVASGATNSGNPIQIGGLAKTVNPTAVSTGQRVSQLYDKLGKAITVGAIRELKGIQQTTITSSTAETTIVSAVASTFLDVYSIIITNTSATVCKVTIKDATGGTTRFVFEVPATETRGFTVPIDSAVPQAVVNNNWTATCGSSVAGIEITVLFVQNL